MYVRTRILRAPRALANHSQNTHPAPGGNYKEHERKTKMRKFITEKLNKFFNGFTMNGRILTFISSVLTLVCIVCVGFSSWIIVNPTVSATVNAAEFDVYTVTDSQTYLSLSSPKGFAYYYTGFADGNGKLVPTGDISVNVEFNHGKANAFFGNEKLLLQFTLYFTGITDETEANKIIPPAECVIEKTDGGGNSIPGNSITKSRAQLEKSTSPEYFLKATFTKSDLQTFITENDTVNLKVTFKLANSNVGTTNYTNYSYENLFYYLSTNGNTAFMIEARVSKN